MHNIHWIEDGERPTIVDEECVKECAHEFARNQRLCHPERDESESEE